MTKKTSQTNSATYSASPNLPPYTRSMEYQPYSLTLSPKARMSTYAASAHLRSKPQRRKKATTFPGADP